VYEKEQGWQSQGGFDGGQPGQPRLWGKGAEHKILPRGKKLSEEKGTVPGVKRKGRGFNEKLRVSEIKAKKQARTTTEKKGPVPCKTLTRRYNERKGGRYKAGGREQGKVEGGEMRGKLGACRGKEHERRKGGPVGKKREKTRPRKRRNKTAQYHPVLKKIKNWKSHSPGKGERNKEITENLIRPVRGKNLGNEIRCIVNCCLMYSTGKRSRGRVGRKGKREFFW